MQLTIQIHLIGKITVQRQHYWLQTIALDEDTTLTDNWITI